MPEPNVLTALASITGIDRFPDLRARLDPEHLESFAGVDGNARLADALRRAAGQAAVDDESLADAYVKRGELRALRSLDPSLLRNVDITAVFAEWQRQVTARLHQAEDRAAVCDRERIQCSDKPTWVAKVGALKEEIEYFADLPGCQVTLIERCRQDLDHALMREKDRMLARINELVAELETRSSELDAPIGDAARSHLQHARQRVENDDFVVGCRRLAQAEAILSDGLLADDETGGVRLAQPRRIQGDQSPDGRSPFHRLVQVAEASVPGKRSTEWSRLVENVRVRDEVLAEDGFVHRHRRSNPQDWGGYFKSMRIWLGLQSTNKVLLPAMPRILPNNNFWSEPKRGARAIFAFAQAWRGAPFYEDPDGRQKVVAILRLAISEADWKRKNYIEQLVGGAVADLITHAKEGDSDDEKRFANHGLVLVLLPGNFLAPDVSYRQFHERLRMEGGTDVKERVAFLDDLDLLRLVPVEPDQRFLAMLELALPRFPNARHRTYVDSSPVASRMFFGRDREMDELDSKATIVFSGRKIGKSSLLRHQVERCTQRDDHRAIFISGAGVAPWHSWRLLEDISVEVKSLLTREGITGDFDWTREQPAQLRTLSEQFPAIAERVKARFHTFLTTAVHALQQRGISRLFVLLDEADSFARAEWVENSGGSVNPRNSVSWFLRDRENELKGFLRFVFAGYDELGRKENLCHSAFGNWGATLNLGPLDEASARRLIAEPLAALGILVNRDTADLILDYTSGHASLIQAFCARMIDVIAEKGRNWPLEDVDVEYADVRTVGERSDYRDDMTKTLGLNLGIARTYPLELVFLGVISPTGLGAGRRLSAEGFLLTDAMAQFENPPHEIRDFSSTTLQIVLDLLVQLGLLEVARQDAPKKYRFRARHYVNHLRTQSGFNDRLDRSLREWNAQSRPVEIIPRHVWTLPEEQLAALYDDAVRVVLLCGLRGSGREFLAETLSVGATLVRTTDNDWEDRLDLAIKEPCKRVVVLDLHDRVAWDQLQPRLTSRLDDAPPLRWIAGPQTAWNAVADVDTLVEIEFFGMGPLTCAELEGWTARRSGDDPHQPPASATIKEADKDLVLVETGGLLPVLELLRRFFTDGLPDPFGAEDVKRFQRYLLEHSGQAATRAKTLTIGMPAEFRQAMHALFDVCQKAGQACYSRDQLEILRELYAESLGPWSEPSAWQRAIDAAIVLGFVQHARSPGQLVVPFRSVLGLLLRHQAMLEV